VKIAIDPNFSIAAIASAAKSLRRVPPRGSRSALRYSRCRTTRSCRAWATLQLARVTVAHKDQRKLPRSHHRRQDDGGHGASELDLSVE
jgi:hypothetical protein